MNNQRDLSKTIDGEIYLSGAAVLLICADLHFGRHEATELGRKRARAFLDVALKEMAAAGYQKGDILETALSRTSTSDSVIELANQGMDLIGSKGMSSAMCAATLIFDPVHGDE